MRDFMLEASISMEGNAMETSDVYTQVFQSLMPLICEGHARDAL